uniref:Uncharacterized protein n=1 Tax=Meloidogyne floridensis TaxID=298350 RepID=A0A915NKJ8_9BILA
MRLTDVNGQPRICLHDLDCLPPAKCLTKIKSCCIFPLNQEVPPIGCPKGTRQLRNKNGDLLNCSPTKPGSCPGGALCYQDSINTEQFRCCGKDPSDGCGTGQRALKHLNGSTLLCLPGTAECPGNGICEWSFDIDRFQCCEADNGCLHEEIPVFDSKGNVISCSPITPLLCPDEAICRFNFWTASYQCCRQNNQLGKKLLTTRCKSLHQGHHQSVQKHIKEATGESRNLQQECPLGEIIYKLSDREDYCSSDVDCPPMGRCNLHIHLCCGPPGECPVAGEHPVFDEQDRVQLCSPTSMKTISKRKCPADSKCRESIDPLSGLLTGQKICCMAQSFECVASGLPFPNEQNPLRCDLQNPITCPLDMLCQASNISGISICCSGSSKSVNINYRKRQRHLNLCPQGWQPYEHLNIFCHPSMTTGNHCPGHASCILSPITKQFICCSPVVSEEGEEDKLNDNDYIDYYDKKEEEDKGEITTGKQNKRSNNKNNIPLIACFDIDDVMDLNEDGNPRRCTLDRRIPCRSGFICQPLQETSFHKYSTFGVCCSERRTPHIAFSASSTNRKFSQIDHQHRNQDSKAFFRCPSSSQIPVIRQGQNLFCELPGQNCPPGSSCQSAMNAFAMMICCRKARQSSPRCPDGMSPERSPIGYVLCELLLPDQCKPGYQCVQSKNDPEQSICCSRPKNARPAVNAQYIFLFRDGSGPRFCSPSATQSNCPKNYYCEEAIGQPGIFVCCSMPAQPICPSGFDSSLDLRSGNPIYCSPSDLSMCPADADCLLAENRANTYLCCESREPGRICPQPGQHALLQINGQPEQCSGPGAPCSKSSYTCQLSYTLNNLYVCCGPPNSAIVCADGRETYHQEFGKTVQCNPMSLYSQCPSGFECALSNVPAMHVCCRRMDAPLPGGAPLPQAQTDIPPPPFVPPSSSSATFRPPIEDLGCPLGWSAYEDHRGAHHFCQDTLDMTCPHGFSCAQSSVEGIFMCCRLASPIQCPQAYSTLMVNNSPRLCSIAARQISSNASPHPAADGFGRLLRQQQTISSPSLSTGQNNNHCPSGYTCMQSSPAVYVCCGINTLPSMSTDIGISKSTSSSSTELLCSNGQIPAYLGQYIRYCSNLGQVSECPPSYVCSPSNRVGLNVCCHPFPVVHRRSTSRSYSDSNEQKDKIDILNICGKGSLVAIDEVDGRSIECDGTTKDECPQACK